MQKILLLSILSAASLNAFGQATFNSPGSQTICSTISPSLATVESTDFVQMSASLRLSASCVDSDLAYFSLNSPASFRKPTFCYNNGYFPDSYGYPIAISRNSTANAGACAGGQSIMKMDFSQGVFQPKGLSFITCDIDNPYDTFKIEVYSNGLLVNYNFEFLEPNKDSSYAYTTHTATSGNSVHFNGGANGVWGESSKSSFWERGAIRFTIDSTIAVDSIIMTHYIRNNRNDINAGISIGNFMWIENDIMNVEVLNLNAHAQENHSILNWKSTPAHTTKFQIERSENGIDWKTLSLDIKTNQLSEISEYTAIDHQPLQGKNYYRLKITEGDNSTYSKVKIVNFNSETPVVTIYPNPSNGMVYLQSSRPIGNVIITNILGQKVHEESVENNNATLNLQGLSKGVYTISIQDNASIKRHKITLK